MCLDRFAQLFSPRLEIVFRFFLSKEIENENKENFITKKQIRN